MEKSSADFADYADFFLCGLAAWREKNNSPCLCAFVRVFFLYESNEH
jgi:hypothetical protein